MVTYFVNSLSYPPQQREQYKSIQNSLEPKKKARKGIITGLKVADEGEDLKKVAQDAFKQIQKRQYKVDMVARGVKDFVIISIAFRGKDMEAVTNC